MFTDNHDMFFGAGFMWIFWIILIIAIVWALKEVATNKRSCDTTRTESPMEILKKRLANGEIDEQEFELKRKKLES